MFSFRKLRPLTWLNPCVNVSVGGTFVPAIGITFQEISQFTSIGNTIRHGLCMHVYINILYKARQSTNYVRFNILKETREHIAATIDPTKKHTFSMYFALNGSASLNERMHLR